MENSQFKVQFKILILCFMFLIFLFSLASFSTATTTCKRIGCEIQITINLVAVGGDQQTINNWINDIESVWNGYTYGDCKCSVVVSVDFKGWVANCSDPATTGNHCIEITPGYARDSSGNLHRAYMKGVSQGGSSISGWWSSTYVNAPLPGVQGPIHDAAHEAGHMLGLQDDYNKTTNTYGNNIMGRTWGPDAKPSQQQINQVVENNCKDNDKCPDECCCGDGKVQKDKGEECEKKEDCTEGLNPLCVKCECFYIEYCGDGRVSGEEECDPNAEPIGCKENETCTEDCKCEEKGKITVNITSPKDGSEITNKTNINVDVNSTLEIEEVKFYFDNSLQFTDDKEPYRWSLDPTIFPEGPHKVKVTAYDVQSNRDSAEINIIIVRE